MSDIAFDGWRFLVLPPLVLALGLSTAHAAPRGQNLFIAGDGFTLDQAMGDAEAQRTPHDSPRYRVLVTGEQVRRLMGVGAAPDGYDVLARARSSGGTIFVCGKDLKALGLRPEDMIPGVVAVRGYLPLRRLEDRGLGAQASSRARREVARRLRGRLGKIGVRALFP
jgi:hypothetical protein